MEQINIQYINPFISAAQIVLKDLCKIDTSVGKPYMKEANYEGDMLAVIIGVTGVLRGQVISTMDVATGCKIASLMMGTAVPALNEMARSSVSELANMILGNAATIFSTKNITVEITPPTITVGTNLSFSISDAKLVCIPLRFEGGEMELNIAIRDVNE